MTTAVQHATIGLTAGDRSSDMTRIGAFLRCLYVVESGIRDVRIHDADFVRCSLTLQLNESKVLRDQRQRIRDKPVRLSKVLSALVNAPFSASFLQHFAHSKSTNQAGTSFSVQVMDSLHYALRERERQSVHAFEDALTIALIVHEICLARRRQKIVDQEINQCAVTGHLSSNLHQNKKTLCLVARCLPRLLSTGDFDRYTGGAVGRLTQAIRDYPKNSRRQHGRDPGPSSPSFPNGRAFAAKPPATKQRLQKLHTAIPPVDWATFCHASSASLGSKTFNLESSQ